MTAIAPDVGRVHKMERRIAIVSGDDFDSVFVLNSCSIKSIAQLLCEIRLSIQYF